MDIQFERDGVIKTTHKKFTKDLEAAGWKVVEPKQKGKKRNESKKTR